MSYVFALIGFGVGGSLGSFAGCAAWRIPRRLSLLGRSHCPGCGAQVPWWLNVPVLSFLVLRGRARCCGARLARRYLLLELTLALLGATVGVFSANKAEQGWPVWSPFATLVGLAAAVVGGALLLSLLAKVRAPRS